MINLSESDKNILAALDQIMQFHIGRREAIKFAHLHASVKSAAHPLTIGERGLRELIEEQRPKICFCTANPGGHFLPSLDPDERRRELNDVIHALDGYLVGAAKKKKAIIAAYPTETGQGSLGI
jgi:hypothetical protein